MFASFSDRCARIELLLLDVDGVLTDGTIVYSDREEEIKVFHVRDGSGIKLWLSLGRKAGIITGRSSNIVKRRAAELGLSPVIQGAEDKWVALEKVLRLEKLVAEQVCYVGDDLPDLPLIRACGLGIAVADACAEVRASADLVTTARGGRGAVREVIEFLLKHQGRWTEVLARYQA